ncbi:MAG TPA: RNA polymerase sigma factor [Bacteroidales bacterium]|nr:RNA polymerase sigma factor [Bacteroidales bacterium]
MDYKGDKFYIENVLNGRTNAFSFLVDHHKDRAFNLAFRICGNREEAEEIVQDSFLKAFRSLGSFKMKSSFSTWLYRIVYNTSVSTLRSGHKMILSSLEESTHALNDFSERSTIDEMADTEHRNKIVNYALQKLEEEDRGIIILYYYEEMPVEDISEVTGLSISAIKTRLFRSRQKMLDVIEKAEKIKILNQ